MEHILVAYNSFIVFIGIFSLVLIFIGRDKKTYLKPYFISHLLFTVIFIILLLKSYVFINLPSPSYQFLNTCVIIGAILHNILLYYAVLTCYLLINKKIINIKLIRIIIGILTIITISPTSFNLYTKSTQIAIGNTYAISAFMYLSVIVFILTISLKYISSVNNKQDKFFLLLIILFAITGFMESLLNLILQVENSTVTLNNSKAEVLISSIPYLIICIYLIIIIFKSILSQKNITTEELIESGFSPRESELILLILDGHTNNRISELLSISIATVKTHINNIFKKANVSNRFELAKIIENKTFPPKG